MTVELSKPEIELLDKALESWEREDIGSVTMSSLLGAVLGPKEDPEASKKRMRDAIAEAQNLYQQKRIKATLLRAKLFQSLARDSEHTLT